MQVLIKSINEVYNDLHKNFDIKEIVHFTKPKWNKKGIYAGEEKKREAKRLKAKGREELSSIWKEGTVILRRKQKPYSRSVRGKIQFVNGRIG